MHEATPAFTPSREAAPAHVSTLAPQINSICCIGAGYVGGPTSAVLACKQPQIQVTVVDANESRINAWNSDCLPIDEPDLLDTVLLARDGSEARRPNLFFSTDVRQAIDSADLIFICVNTPTKSSGVGSGVAMDIGAVEEVARLISHSPKKKIVVEKSTVPCRTADALRDILAANSPAGVNHTVLSNPEFLAEGTAVRNLEKPDRVLIGHLPTDAEDAQALAKVYTGWVPSANVITMNLWSSELSKLTANAFLAQRISSINSISAICEAVGGNIDEIAHAVGCDSRIGSGMLKASIGFGGSCFQKDVLSLVYLAGSLHLPQVADYWRAVIRVNEWQKERFVAQILRRLNGTLRGKRLAVLGFAYKKGTGDTRESAAISVVSALVAEGAQVTIFDPKVPERQIFAELGAMQQTGDLANVTVVKEPHLACQDATAVIVLTECDEFRPRAGGKDSDKDVGNNGLDWKQICCQMKRPAFVFDGRNILDRNELQDLGFRVHSIGR